MKDSLDIALEPTRWLILNHLKRSPEGRTFIWLRETMILSDGNLFSHLRELQRHRLVRVEKRFKDKKPFTTYRLSKNGEALIPKVLSFINYATFDELDRALMEKAAE